jgi:hypothetical protein
VELNYSCKLPKKKPHLLDTHNRLLCKVCLSPSLLSLISSPLSAFQTIFFSSFDISSLCSVVLFFSISISLCFSISHTHTHKKGRRYGSFFFFFFFFCHSMFWLCDFFYSFFYSIFLLCFYYSHKQREEK